MIGIPTAAPGSRLRQWWSRRPLRARITIAVGLVSLIVLLALSRLGVVFLYGAVLDAADAELRVQAVTVSVRIAGGTPASEVRNAQIRVVDNAGAPVDDGPPLPLTPAELRRLAAGESVLSGRLQELRIWVAVPAVALDGSTRRVVVTADLVGAVTLLGRAAIASVVGAVLASVVVALAAWIATRAALRPVDRMRLAAAALPPGERLPVPTARDELRGLAEEINRLLARRDDAAIRLERFTGDAAHELRSPVAAIRAQAEVAVAHPDPELTSETLRAVVDESARLTSMLSDLLALTRADSGQRPPAVPVDLVAAAGAAIARFPDSTDHPVLQLAAPTPAQVSATPSEVALVLDNLIGNALRFARSVVRVAVLPAGQWVRLIVEDDGPGIPEEDRRRVFDRFVRVSPEVGGGGAGLGLALVAALVQARGGTATAGAAPSGGARIEVRWPVA